MAVKETPLAVASSWVLPRNAPGPRRSIDLLCPKLRPELTFKKLRAGGDWVRMTFELAGQVSCAH